MISCVFAQEIDSVKQKELSDDDFVSIYADHYYLTQQYLSEPDTLLQKQDSLFQSKGISQDDFINVLKKYENDTEKYIQIWEKISTEIETRKKKYSQVEKKD